MLSTPSRGPGPIGPAVGPGPPGNYRDVGGWVTRYGVLAPGRLLRGALHDGNAPPSDAARCAPVHLLDLRRPEEGTAARAPSWVCRHPWPLQDPQWRSGGAKSAGYFVYSALRLVRPAAGPTRDAILLLGRGCTVHVGCRLGKDRTGLVLLLLGRLLGVPDAALVDDYLLTARAFAEAPEWVAAYADARGEDVAVVAARLTTSAEVPNAILERLPDRAALMDVLDIDETDVRSAALASSDA